MAESIKKIVPNPCIGVCALGDRDLCIACRRSGIEIAEWGVFTDEEKSDVWRKIGQREAGDFSE